MNLLVTFIPVESKRLIAKAVTVLPEVIAAMQKGRVVIGNGTSTAYVAEELLHTEMEKWKFPSGVITSGRQCQTPVDRLRPLMIIKGQVKSPNMDIPMYDEFEDFISSFTSTDVFIKGANAIDSDGNAGFLLAHANGGQIGMSLGTIAAQGSHLIVPVGLEKMIGSVTEAARNVPGINNFRYSFGRGTGYLAVNNAKVITEIEALRILTGVKAVHLASGGVGGTEGAVTLSVSGEEQQVCATVDLVRQLKKEKPFQSWRMSCIKCQFKCSFQEK